MKFELSTETIKANFERFMDVINVILESRSENLVKMYAAYGESFVIAPASSYEHFHNAVEGGYVDHVLRVMDNAFIIHKLWKDAGIEVDNFTTEELTFAAIHHDLGKLGFEGDLNRRYITNTSSWHYDNMGRCYEINEQIPHLEVPDLALHMLQKYQIPVSLNELLGIKLTDGLYDDANKAYYMGRSHNQRLRTHLPHILHQADMMASQFEYDRWSKATGRGFKKIIK